MLLFNADVVNKEDDDNEVIDDDNGGLLMPISKIVFGSSASLSSFSSASRSITELALTLIIQIL